MLNVAGRDVVRAKSLKLMTGMHVDRLKGTQRYQAGQSMLLGLVICAVAIAAWFSMLELGRRVHDQASLNRATDAAAYSAALIYARGLNMHAYLNRAQLGHQIVMAHLIAAATTARFSSQLSTQASRRNPPASLIGAFFGPQHAFAYMKALDPGVTDGQLQEILKNAYLRHERQIHQVLNQVRQLQVQDFDRQRDDAINRMLVTNIGESGAANKGHSLKQLGLSSSLIVDEAKGFVKLHSANDGFWRGFLKDSVGQYGYLAERKETKRNVWLVNPRCPRKRHELRRRGRLQLGDDGQWLSEDSLSFHALRYNKLIGCYQREYPMGWAVVETHGSRQGNPLQTGGLPDFSKQAFWRWTRRQHEGSWNIFNGRNNPLAQRYGQASAIRWASKGLGQYAQVSEGRERKPVRFALKVTQKISSEQTIQSLASAQTYFAPPKHTQSRQPSLFEPYWQATLIPNVIKP